MSGYGQWSYSDLNSSHRSLSSYSSSYSGYPPSSLDNSRHRRQYYAEDPPRGRSQRPTSEADGHQKTRSRSGTSSGRYGGSPPDDLLVLTDYRSTSYRSKRRGSVSGYRASYHSSRSAASGYSSDVAPFLPFATNVRSANVSRERSRSTHSSHSRVSAEQVTGSRNGNSYGKYSARRNGENEQRSRSHNSYYATPQRAVEGVRTAEHRLRRVGHLDDFFTRAQDPVQCPPSHDSRSAAYADGGVRLTRHSSPIEFRYVAARNAGSNASSGQQYPRPIYASSSETSLDPYQRQRSSSVYLRPTPRNTDEVYPEDSISEVMERSAARAPRQTAHESSRASYDGPELRRSNYHRRQDYSQASRLPAGFIDPDRYSGPYSGYSK